MKRLLALIALLSFCGLAALAQSEGDENDNGFLINMLQNQLSGPGRQIRVSGVSGLLSSQARIEEVTVSDDKGAWLTLHNVALDWTRSSLLLGRVNINRLAADEIDLARRPEIPPTPVLEQTEAKPFQVPELPVRIRLQELAIARFSLGEPVAGVAAELSVNGSLNLAGGALDTTLAAKRLDPPGGTLDLRASFANDTRQLGLDLHLQEPQGGLVSTLLDIENQPPIDLRLTGDGPLDNVDIRLALDAAGERLAEGTLALRGSDEGLGFKADFKGAISPLVPAPYREFFAGETVLSANGLRRKEGGTRLDALSLQGAVLSLQGSFDTTADGFPRSVDLTGSLGDPKAAPVTLPVPGGATTLNSARLYLSYGQQTRWNGLVVLDRLAARGIEMEDVTLDMGGLAENIEDPAKRSVTLALQGLATGVTARDPAVAQAIGDRFDLFADAAMPAGGPVEVRQLQLSGTGLSIFSSGTLRDWVYDGRNSVRVDDLAPLGALAGRDLGGAVDLDANGSVSPLSGGFDLTLAGTATDVTIGDPRVDALMAGETTLEGRAVRDQNGIRTEGLRIGNAQFSVASDGRVSSSSTDFTFDARVADLGLVDPRLGGELTASGTAKGTGGEIGVDFDARVPEGKLMDRPLTGADLGFTGTLAGFGGPGMTVRGDIRGGGEFDGQSLALAGNIDTTGGQQEISGLRVAVGPNTVAGDLTRARDGLLTGKLAVRAPDIAPIAALALTEGSGSIEADLAFAPENGKQGVDVSANGRDIVVAGNAIESLELDAAISDALGVPLVNGTLAARSIRAGGLEIASVDAKAEQAGENRMTFSADSRLAIGTLIDTTGAVEQLEPGIAVTLDTLRLRQDPRIATLTAPATITVKDGATTLTPLKLDFGTGSLSAQGTIADTFDLDVVLDALPLDIANAIAPALGAAGEITGTARVTGARAAPDVDFDVAASGLGVAATRNAGVPPLALTATGATENGRLGLDAAASAPNGLDLRVTGGVPMAQGGAMDLDVTLASLPLAMVDGLAGNQGLRGDVTGGAKVTGTFADPRASFELNGDGLSIDTLAAGGTGPLTLRARGDFADQTVTIAEARLGGGDGVDFNASGRIPLAGSGLDVSGSGALPLSLANAFLAGRDAQAAGLARLDFRATGALTAPVLSGSVRLSGGTFVDPQTNVRLNDIALDAALAGDTVEIRDLSANAAAGGGLAASGTIGLGAGLPADLDLRINNLRYTDGAMVATRLSGNLSATGPLLGDGLISGQVNLGDTEISIAEGLGAGASANLEQVIHHLPPPRVSETLGRAGLGVEDLAAAEEASSGGGSPLRLDVLVRAPRIFVRGRGLDVELGGETRIRGTVSDVQPVGQFDLRRGRLSILNQRLDFDEGSLTLVGNLDPQIHFVASTESEDVTAYITVEGSATAPEIKFTSDPELPQDEVLARILFNRASDSLSPFQLAQLAAAAAELAGGGGGLMDQVRSSAGLADLDIVTQDNGSLALRAGRYVSDSVYVDVQTGADGVSQAEVQIELTPRVDARGSVGSDGNTTLGLFYTRDY
ncbi:translocation/assembly module TamB domain-containing protein [Amaricoccus solimangrovi]|uniref:Translocation/assembly module TamB n=1 Tax=Amaricoccus solimangrovi TaxID=2589815 RepID=A0A501WX00_9RHOB|nr:translocation/assembly module TamB domain-containing protein [Amaricoccus solimangrovi]TPE51471.1 translocation/assembly module TamB [Amaricoccus solimangrovi]